MTTLRKRTNQTARACQEYAFSVGHDHCELTRYLIEDRDAAKWISEHLWQDKMEVHHIAGRPLPNERDYFCNLLRISKAAHDYCGRFKHASEICCWKAKLDKHRAQLERDGGVELEVCRQQFSVTALNIVVTPFCSFAGRVEFLKTKVVGTVFEAMADKLLEVA